MARAGGIIALLLSLAPCLLSQPGPRVVINEFLASNVSTSADIVDFDDFSDWIELYNDSDVDVDLGGFSLTDDPGDPNKWQIPSGTFIAAHGFLVLWADGYDEVPGRLRTRPYPPYEKFHTRYYHLNFKLDAAGEFIGLGAPDGSFLDSLTFGMQLNDVSRGRQPDGEATWFFFGEPTPEAANSTPGIVQTRRAGTPSVTPPSGFYSVTQLVAIAPPTPGAEVRYTLDGSIPTGQSELYIGPIPVEFTTTLRLRAFESGHLPGPVVTQTYFLQEPTYLPTVSICTDQRLLWDRTIGIYDNMYREREIPVHMELFDPGGAPAVSVNAGLTLTGQFSLLYPQKSFTISTDDRFGDEEIAYQVFPQRELNTFYSLYFRNGGLPDHRSTLIRDALLHVLVVGTMDLDCQAYRPVAAFLDGRYWGVYTLREKINGAYLSSLHKVNPEAIDLLEYILSPDPDVMEGDADAFSSFYQYVSGHDLSEEGNYRAVESMMDVDEFINYQIAEIYSDNVIWGDQNVRMWRERKEGARWRWILFDTDFGFGMPNQISNGYTHNTLRYATSSNYGSQYILPAWSTLLFRRLLANQEFRTKFIQRFGAYLNTVFHADTVEAAIDRIRDEIGPGMSRHIYRWNTGPDSVGVPIPNYAAWLTNLAVVRAFARGRPAYQRQHIVDYFTLAGITVLNAAVSAEGTGSVLINGIERVRDSVSSRYFKGVPVRLEAVPEAGYRFVRWEGVDSTLSNPVEIIPGADTLALRAVFEATGVSVLPDRVSADLTLSAVHSPFHARATITVDSGATLSITEGTHILMPEGASIVIHGRLIAEGTEQSPVIIRPNEHARRWGALCFVDAADSSAVTNLDIIGASCGPDFARDLAAISGYRSRFSLENVSVVDVRMPVFVRYGSVSLRGCTLRSPVAGDLINVKYADFALTENCDLMGDDEYDSDGIDYDGIRAGTIRGNRIRNIYGFNSDAIDLGEGSRDILIEGNVVYNVTDKGVSVGQASTALVRRNILANCGMGIAVKDFDSYARIEQNTLHGNQVGIAAYEKILGHGGGRAEAVNCIIADSRSSATFVDGLSSLGVSYSISNTGSLPGLHNQNADPRLLNEFRPARGSPAIDTGSPLLPADPDGSLPDIGARPYDSQAQENIFIDEIHYHPIEGSGHEFIEIVNAGASPVHLGGYRVEGDVAHRFEDLQLAAGERLVLAMSAAAYQGKGYQVVQWDSGQLPDGAGILVLRNAAGDMVDAVDYNNGYFWPTQPDGFGPSLELHRSALENLVSTSWRASYVRGGTPGASPGSALVTGIYINEFMAENDTACTDEEGENDDWIEVYNSSPIPVDLGGMGITDNFARPDKWIVPRTDPQLTTVPSGGFLVLWADGQPEQGVLHLGFKLDKSGERIGLAQDLDTGFVYIDTVSYGTQSADVSFGRYPDGSAIWISMYSPSPGSDNVNPNDVDGNPLPEEFALMQNFPNPFNPVTTIRFTIADRRLTIVSVYDLLGREVATLVNEVKEPGTYDVRFSVAGGAGLIASGPRSAGSGSIQGAGGSSAPGIARGLASGVYIYRLTSGTHVETKKMLLVK